MCLLLDHVHCTDAFFNDQDIDKIRRVIILADRFGLEQLAQRCLRSLTEIRCIRESFESELRRPDPERLTEWIWVAQRFPYEKLKDYVAKSLADNHFGVFAHKASGTWDSMTVSIEVNMWRRIALGVHRNFQRALKDVQRWGVGLDISKGEFLSYRKTYSELFSGFWGAEDPVQGFQVIYQRVANGERICSLGTAVARFKRCQ